MTASGLDPRRAPGIQRGKPSGKKPHPGVVFSLILITVVALVAGFSSLFSDSDDDTRSTPVAESVSKYTQTWGQAYSDTSCADWNDQMTSGQKFAASADILASARNKIDGGTGLPSDALIDEFSAGVTTVCIIPSMTLMDATYGLYTTEPRFHP